MDNEVSLPEFKRGPGRPRKIKTEEVMEEKNEKKIELTQADMKRLLDGMNDMRNEMDKLQAERLIAERKIAELQKHSEKTAVETTFERFSKKRPGNENPAPPKIVNEPAEFDPSTGQSQEMKHDCCPYCIKFNPGQKHILDRMPATGKFSCRLCGKHWPNHTWDKSLLGTVREYSPELESIDSAPLLSKERLELARKEQIVVEK